MSFGSLFAPLGGLFTRFERGGRSALWVQNCGAIRCQRPPAYAVPYCVRRTDFAWRYIGCGRKWQ